MTEKSLISSGSWYYLPIKKLNMKIGFNICIAIFVYFYLANLEAATFIIIYEFSGASQYKLPLMCWLNSCIYRYWLVLISVLKKKYQPTSGITSVKCIRCNSGQIWACETWAKKSLMFEICHHSQFLCFDALVCSKTDISDMPVVHKNPLMRPFTHNDMITSVDSRLSRY